MNRMVSVFGAREAGDRLVKSCREIREKDLQKGRQDLDAIDWLASQVASFALYIKVLAQEEGLTGKMDYLINQMIEEVERITRYHMARAIRPDAPVEELFV